MARKSEKTERGFSVREARALLWLLPVLAVASWLVWEITRADGWAKVRKEGDASYRPVETDDDSVRVSHGISTISLQESSNAHGGSSRTPTGILPSAEADGSTRDSLSRASAQLFIFDPNTVEFHELVRLGFTRGEALGIVKYRQRGKVFEIPEDFAACYQVSEEMYLRLKPYIRIGEKYRLKPFTRTHDNENGSAAVRGGENGANGAGGQRVSNSTFVETEAPPRPDGNTDRMAPDGIQAPFVDLNTADSAALISVRGIGERTVMRIIALRDRLGGFASVEQLAEVSGMTEQNYDMILEQVFADPAGIKKININFAPAKSLAAHPYIRAEALRKLLKQRQLKGGWRTPEELENDDIFTAEELAKLGPYLVFD